MAAEAWLGARRVGTGSASAQPLDWWKAVSSQATPCDPLDAEVILAAECVWLKDLVEPFAETVVALLHGHRSPTCVLAFRERAVETSETFSSLERVIATFAERGVSAVERGVLDAPESRGLLTTFYELRLVE